MNYSKPQVVVAASAVYAIESGSGQKPVSTLRDANFPIQTQHTDGAYEADE